MSAQEKTSGLKRARHSREERPLTFQKWRMEFRRLTKSTETWTSLLKRLGKHGCESTVLEQLLYNVVATEKKPMAPFKRAARELLREVQSFLPELNHLATKVRKLNAIFLPGRRGDLSHCDVPYIHGTRSYGDVLDIDGALERFESLPEILVSYGQHFERIAAMSNVRTMDDHGPELTMLATYLRVKTGRPLYKDLVFLLDHAHYCAGQQLEHGSDPQETIRKALDRYKGAHPKTYEAIVEGVSNYERLPISVRGYLVAHLRWELSRPGLMMDQYHKSGKRSHTKRAH